MSKQETLSQWAKLKQDEVLSDQTSVFQRKKTNKNRVICSESEDEG